MAGGVFTQAQRRACFQRAQGCCEVCGRYVSPVGFNLHHRIGRGMGGTKRKVTCADGLVVCGHGTVGCHLRMDDERKWAEAHGYVIPRAGGVDPESVPVLTAAHGWVYFQPDGTTRKANLHPLINAHTGEGRWSA